MSILLTGGSGILGQELQKHIKCAAPSRKQLDILNDLKGYWLADLELIVHAAAYTDVAKAEIEKELCYQTNVIGTRNLANLGIPMLYISTEYVFDGQKGNYNEEDYPNPQNFYAFTKLLGEYESKKTRSVVIRCLFKPCPFEHDAACIDQFTTGDYVDIIAKEIVSAIKNYNRLPATIHIGTGRKTIYELARQSRPDIKPIKVEEIRNVELPRDISLNTSLWEKIKNAD